MAQHAFVHLSDARDRQGVGAGQFRLQRLVRRIGDERQPALQQSRGLDVVAERAVARSDHGEHCGAVLRAAARVGECKPLAAREHVVDRDRLAGFRRFRDQHAEEFGHGGVARGERKCAIALGRRRVAPGEREDERRDRAPRLRSPNPRLRTSDDG